MRNTIILGLVLIFLELSFASASNPFFRKKPFSFRASIQLLDPVKEGGTPVYDTMMKRESKRDFIEGQDLTLAELSQLLWAAYGPNRPNGYKTCPSSKAKYPFDIYVFLRYGTYKYDPAKNILELLNYKDYRAVTGEDSFVASAFANLVYVGVLEREEFLPDIEQRKLGCRVDVGHTAMNALLYCADAGLKCVPRANIDQNKIFEVLGLDDKDYYIPLCLSAGN